MSKICRFRRKFFASKIFVIAGLTTGIRSVIINLRKRFRSDGVKKVTIRDLAAACGISVSSVSKALHDSSEISEATKQAVRDQALRIGYTANLPARMLGRKRTVIAVGIGFCPPEVRSLFRLGFLAAMERYEDFGVEIRFLSEGPGEELDGTDALIAFPIWLNENRFVAERFAEKHPTVILQSRCPEFSGAVTTVVIDAAAVGRLAADLLALQGCSFPGVIMGDRSAWIHSENLQGFFEQGKRYGFRKGPVAESHDSMEYAFRETERLLSAFPAIDGLFVSSYVAPAVCRVFRNRRSIPVVGVDLFPESREYLLNGTLSAVLFQNQQMQAQTAVQAVLDAFCGSSVPDEIRIKPEVILPGNVSFYSGQMMWKAREKS